jgi:hypothetical protein
MKATRISSSMMKRARAIEAGAIATPPTQLILAISAIRRRSVVITMWPASMLAKSRIMRAKGFVNMLRISTGIMIGSSHAGSPGGTRLWKCPTRPYFEIPAYCWAAKEMRARPIVTARFPVEVAAKGVRPRSAATRMKKKKLQRRGVNFRPSAWPMFFRDLVPDEHHDRLTAVLSPGLAL